MTSEKSIYSAGSARRQGKSVLPTLALTLWMALSAMAIAVEAQTRPHASAPAPRAAAPAARTAPAGSPGPAARPTPASAAHPGGAPQHSAGAAQSSTQHPGAAPATTSQHATGATQPTNSRSAAPAASTARNVQAGSHPAAPTRLNAPAGGSVHATRAGGEVAKAPDGHVTAYRGAHGQEAHFDAHGGVREVHANGMTIRRGPAGERRVEVERADHSRVVAYGGGRGYIEHRYEYGGHPYYARAYYYHGAYYRGYYSGYYYHGAYFYGYRPAYYYPPVYYGWAYNPWPAPAPYAWGWYDRPWYGYYGAYFRPYPVYPSAAYWITDYMVARSLEEAYAAATAGNAAGLRTVDTAHLTYAAYDPSTGTTSPTMSKEVKDAVADEIKLELAAQQKASDPSANNAGSLETLLSDGKPHVFIASAGLSVSSAGTDCALTEGDVLALNAPPAADTKTADLRVLASKQADCHKGSVVAVELNDLQEMHNHLLASIDKGMAEMKDHPGQGGLPAPPAAAIAATREAPYAAAAPPADPNGGAELDKTAQEGAQTERQVVSEATAPDDGAGVAASPIGGVAAPAAPNRGPAVIALGETPEEVVALKGQPANKVAFPGKTVFIYPDMKITFKNGKLIDVQ